MSVPGQLKAKALDYQPSASAFDEVYDVEGGVRPHWQYLLDSFQAMGAQGLGDRQKKASRILRDDGATYTIYNERASSQTWALDPVPLVIDSEQWQRIEAGLQERAEVLNLLLNDIYGDRELIRRGILPPELLYSHSGFLRACQGVKIPGEHQLILYAADMVRNRDGDMCVIGDRTQSPSGAGYALENRTVMSRILPSLYRDSHVHRLSLFFRQLRQKLNELGPNGDVPRVVVLTPGAYNETYFEHAYLANYLGFSLVQGGDLTVRNGYLWMKSLDGLTRVDVVLRRVDDYFCDPVELKGDSHLGVPGLLDVVRTGRVVVANPLGSAVLENTGLLRYLPEVSRYFLGRDLRLAAVKTYWCGDSDDREHVLKNIDKLVLKTTTRRPGWHSSVFGSELSDEQKAQWCKRITENPLMYVAQEAQGASMSPSWQGDALVRRPVVLRSFAVASESSYAIMPGGLTRVAKDEFSKVVTNQGGSVSKDTWVIASEPEKQVSLLSATHLNLSFSDQRTDLPSRVVENLFWLGRYAERAECTMRLLRTVFMQLNSGDQLPASARALLLHSVTVATATFPGFGLEDINKLNAPEEELLSVIINESKGGSVISSLSAMLSSADQVKEMLSADTRRITNDLRDELATLKENLAQGLPPAPEEVLDPLVSTLLAFAGLSQESMVRGMGWRFLEMGRRLERALQTVTLLRSLLVTPVDENSHPLLLEALLISFESLITYRRRYRAQMDVANGLELLLLDQSNPRSLVFQVQRLREHYEQLPAEPTRGLSKAARLILEARDAVLLSDLDQLATVEGEPGQRVAMDLLFVRVSRLLSEAAVAIGEKYFDHTAGPQPLLRPTWE